MTLNETLQAENAALRQRVAELEQTEQRLRAVFAGITDIILVMDQHGQYLDILPTNPDLLYRPPQELVGRTLHEVMPPDLADQFLAIITQVLTSGVSNMIEYMLPIGEREIWFNATIKPVSTSTVVMVARDITKRKQAEQSLQRDHEFFLRGPVVIIRWIASEGYPVDYVSPNVRSIFGYSAEDFTSGRLSYADFIHPTDLERIAAEVQAHSTTGDLSFGKEYRVIDAQGTVRWIYDFTTIMRDNLGQITHYDSYLMDITIGKQTEAELRIFQTLIEHMPDAVGIADLRDGMVVYGNPAQRQLHAEGANTIGTSFRQYFEEAALERLLQETLTHGVGRAILTNKRRDGSTFPGHVTAVAIKDADGHPHSIMGIVRDLTEQQRAEDERVALQEQIIAAQQNAIRELSTPLIPITNNAMIMPLIGSIDSLRARQIMEALLTGINTHQFTVAILDITGVQVVDTQVANALVRTARAVKLLGAQVVLTGIQPQVAQTLVELGVELEGIITRSTLQAGIAYILQPSSDGRKG